MTNDFQTINLFGYADLKGFSCAFWGGFWYAFPTLISIFYSVCIALNTQLVFVFSKRPGYTTLKYYIFVPIIISAFICIPALSAGVYGYDASYDLCWYASDGTHQQRVVIRYVLTFGMWCLACMVFLVVSAGSIVFAVFSKASKMNQLATSLSRSLGSSAPRTPPVSAPGSALPKISIRPSSGHSKYTVPDDIGMNNNQPTHFFTPTQSAIGGATNQSGFDSEPVTPIKSFSKHKRPYSTTQSAGSAMAQHPSGTVSRRSLAMRALALRLLGYILIPTICILPGVIQDFLSKVSPNVASGIPDGVTTMLDTLNGLVGLLNAILFSLDPALLALYHQMRMARKEKKAMEQSGGARHRDIEMAPTGTVYTTPPESPSSKSPRDSQSEDAEGNGSSAERHRGKAGPSDGHETQTFVTAEGESESASASQSDLGNGTKVEVRTGKFLAPILVGSRIKKSERGLPSPRSISAYGNGGAGMPGSGILIQVEVEVDSTGNDDLDRLERYLGGL